MGDFVSFNTIASFDEVYSYIVAMITFFTILKFLKLLRFNRRIEMLAKTLRYARRDLSSFGFVFLIFILAYTQMGFAIFSRSLRAYNSFHTSLTTCFRMLLGQINAPEMVAVSRVYGKLRDSSKQKFGFEFFRYILFCFIYYSGIYRFIKYLFNNVSVML